jgi:phage tail-like protein
MPANVRTDPLPKFKFVVEIEGIRRAGFQTCSGLEEESEVREYREGGMPNSVRKLAGLTTYSPIVLEWGSAFDDEIWLWRQKVKRMGANKNRKPVSVVQQDEAGKETKRWQIYDAWPSKYTAPEFDAASSENAVESVELQHEGLNLIVKQRR